MSTADWEDHPDGEPEVSNLDDFLDYHRPDPGLNCGLNQETDSLFGDCCAIGPYPLAGQVHQEMTTDIQSFGVSLTESVGSEDNDPLARGLSLGVGHEVLSDRDTAEQIRCFSEGRRLLFGV